MEPCHFVPPGGIHAFRNESGAPASMLLHAVLLVLTFGGIESMAPDEYERASYYERWLFSIETRLTEEGVLAPGELDARLAT